MANTMFRVSFKQLADEKTYTIDSFDILNPSESKTSASPKLAFASAMTIEAAPNKLLALSVNGKSLELRTPDMALTNEIHVFMSLKQ